jgi:hypothetical protein
MKPGRSLVTQRQPELYNPAAADLFRNVTKERG